MLTWPEVIIGETLSAEHLSEHLKMLININFLYGFYSSCGIGAPVVAKFWRSNEIQTALGPTFVSRDDNCFLAFAIGSLVRLGPWLRKYRIMLFPYLLKPLIHTVVRIYLSSMSVIKFEWVFIISRTWSIIRLCHVVVRRLDPFVLSPLGDVKK